MTTALDREAFPLTPPGGRTPYSSEAPSGEETRPWALRFARVPDSTGGVRVPSHVYDASRQVNVSDAGGLLPCMGTHSPTVPDGSTSNPPPLDEGPKD
ncbi:putative ATP-grasp-modified RiPP [Streptomyces olivaceus]|uniref:putative ATP-grasp-modified RiPP n=1 Tax=Streptomyces olivaceus TaxID=47716 RepID=UPI001CCFC2E8|nr:putative ATP-grasp-modified RiPP [Streptomyces olivaceus]MBZ6253599.1 putative ATP-grasp-modified RiPP [Streptomyces olivaceus]